MYFKIDDKNRVYFQITDRYAGDIKADGITTFKIDKLPEVNHEDVLCYNPNTATFYTENYEVNKKQNEEARAIATAIEKKNNALKWLADNDWKINKVFIGEWADTDPRWLEYLEQRNKARADIDAADVILNK